MVQVCTVDLATIPLNSDSNRAPQSASMMVEWFAAGEAAAGAAGAEAGVDATGAGAETGVDATGAGADAGVGATGAGAGAGVGVVLATATAAVVAVTVFSVPILVLMATHLRRCSRGGSLSI